ncbi:MAG TPA: fibronectin type III domain-containing protein, partial [Planctomycetota bacterium]|nr:fibronectin type III domain-containing protein [Planctomycetota bacterium]
SETNGGPGYGSGLLYMGGRGGAYNLPGEMDEVKLYAGVLTAGEVTTLYDAEKGAFTSSWSPIYDEFNQFCIEEFGAENEPLVYDTFGSDLVFAAEGDWQYSSVESAVVAFETNLPATSFVRFGETSAYGRTTVRDERPFYLHVQYLSGLDPETTYHYQLVAEDERGNVLTSEDRTFVTDSLSGWTTISASQAAPYVLDQPGAYLVTEDLVVDHLAFDITSSDVTLDLGGHTVIYDNVHMGEIVGDWTVYLEQSAIGVRAAMVWGRTNIRILNGTIRQGAGQDKGSDSSGLGFNPIFARGVSGEIAGVTAEYGGPQVSGIVPLYCPDMEVHHNVIKDEGTVITNRGMGLDALSAGYDAHHNLIKRARHRGVNAYDDSEIRDNEIYVDSYATNSYGIMAYQTTNSLLHDNRIFGTGYIFLGIGTIGAGVSDVEIHSNYIQVQATAPTSRWPEYGDISDTYCVRISYSPGADNLNYHDNVLVAKARDGGRARGTWFQGNDDVTNVVFRNNIVKLLYETPGVVHLGDQPLWRGGAIVLCGDGDNSDDAQMLFADNVIISNYRNIAFSDGWYGTANNTLFTGNRIVKVGDRADYLTIDSGFWYWDSLNNVLVDSILEGGASYDLVGWIGTGAREFTVAWTLTVNTEPYANVTIEDSYGVEVFTGQADATGTATAVLVQYLQAQTGRTYSTPHTVGVEKDGETASVLVTMDETQEVDLYLA